MSTSRHIDKICIAVIAVTLVITLLFMNGEALGIAVMQRTLAYENKLFDTSYVHEIDIVMDDWDSFIEDCENEEYSACTVVVDGEKYSNIAIRAKGNTSLSNVSSLGSERYSFKLEFDHYDSACTLDGLDKLCLNNLIQDNTMMKDYIVYQLMNDFGVDSPLCSFAYITVNGEDWGLYLAVEGIEDSFLSRNYGSEDGDLYKPDSMSFGGGKGNGKDFSMDDFDFGGSDEDSTDTSDNSTSDISDEKTSSEDTQNGNSSFTPGNMSSGMQGGQGMKGGQGNASEMPDNMQMPEGMELPDDMELPDGMEMPDMSGNMQMPDINSDSTGETDSDNKSTANPFGDGNSASATDGETMQDGNQEKGGMSFGGGMGSDDVKLKYTDDDPDSYSNIFDNAKTDVTSEDETRLIEALKNLNEYTNLSETLDTEEVIRYFVVHNFVCNGDSYTGSMIHNYYLYENEGQLSMIPWDYNLAFGTFQGGEASSTVNTSIDSPVSGGDVDDRPMLGWIFSDESYTEQYHELFAEFTEKWFTNGELTQLISDTADIISSYVEKDPTKFCTYEEFETGVEALSQFVTLRAEAVNRQLAGDETEVDTGSLNLSDMGTMSNTTGGGNAGGMTMPGSFDMSSFVTLTDSDGNEVELSSVIEDITAISSLTLSDGTTVDLSDFDMKNISQTDLTDIISATDEDGTVYDLSAYTITFNMSSMFGSDTEKGGNAPDMTDMGGTQQGGQPSDTGEKPTAQTSDGESTDNASSTPPQKPDGENADSDGQTPQMPSGDNASTTDGTQGKSFTPGEQGKDGMPGGDFSPDATSTDGASDSNSSSALSDNPLLIVLISLAVLGLGFVVAIFIKGKLI